MSTEFDAKFAELRARIIDPGDHRGALLFVYDPGEDHAFRKEIPISLDAAEIDPKRSIYTSKSLRP